MYNPYIPGSGEMLPPEPPSPPPAESPPPVQSSRSGDGKAGGLTALLKHFKLEELDSGDILLMLIMLFLFLDGDDLELVITLGLILLMGLD